mgnify:CR=1 FL=1
MSGPPIATAATAALLLLLLVVGEGAPGEGAAPLMESFVFAMERFDFRRATLALSSTIF